MESKHAHAGRLEIKYSGEEEGPAKGMVPIHQASFSPRAQVAPDFPVQTNSPEQKEGCTLVAPRQVLTVDSWIIWSLTVKTRPPSPTGC